MKEPIPDVYQGHPVATAQMMKDIDYRAAKRGLDVLTLMENAGRAVAMETVRYLKDSLHESGEGVQIVVCCGRGSNGGDGLVAARILSELGAEVSAFLIAPKSGGAAEYPEPVRVNKKKAEAAGVKVEIFSPISTLGEALASARVVLDALLGTGAGGKPAGPARDMIQAITRSKKPVLAVDIPSGLDPDTGHHSGVFVTAAATFTLGLPKRGLLASHAKKNVGKLFILDIGYPAELLKLGD